MFFYVCVWRGVKMVTWQQVLDVHANIHESESANMKQKLLDLFILKVSIVLKVISDTILKPNMHGHQGSIYQFWGVLNFKATAEGHLRPLY